MEFFGDVCHALSFPRSYGQIYGFAYVSPDPICFEDVVERLCLSKGAASQGLRWLKAAGALISRRPPDGGGNGARHTRREYFSPNTEFSALVQIVFRERVELPLRRGAERIDRISRALRLLESGNGDERPGVARLEHLRGRIEQLRRWHRLSSRFTPRALLQDDPPV